MVALIDDSARCAFIAEILKAMGTELPGDIVAVELTDLDPTVYYLRRTTQGWRLLDWGAYGLLDELDELGRGVRERELSETLKALRRTAGVVFGQGAGGPPATRKDDAR